MVLLQIRSSLISPRLPSLATLMFNRLTTGMLPQFIKQLVLCDNNENNIIVLTVRQPQSIEDTHRNIPSLLRGSAVVIQQEDSGPWNNNGAWI